MRENTVFELAMLVRTMAKGVAGVPSMISIKDMSLATAMYVMSIMADTKVSKALLIEGLYYISVEKFDIVATMQGKCTRVYQNSDILGRDCCGA
jgi:hypothetical protein